MASDELVDVTYRGLDIGRGLRLSEVGPSTAYVTCSAPVPVGTQVVLAADNGSRIDARVLRVHESTGKSGAGMWVRIADPDDDDTRAWWEQLVSTADPVIPESVEQGLEQPAVAAAEPAATAVADESGQGGQNREQSRDPSAADRDGEGIGDRDRHGLAAPEETPDAAVATRAGQDTSGPVRSTRAGTIRGIGNEFVYAAEGSMGMALDADRGALPADMADPEPTGEPSAVDANSVAAEPGLADADAADPDREGAETAAAETAAAAANPAQANADTAAAADSAPADAAAADRETTAAAEAAEDGAEAVDEARPADAGDGDAAPYQYEDAARAGDSNAYPSTDAQAEADEARDGAEETDQDPGRPPDTAAAETDPHADAATSAQGRPDGLEGPDGADQLDADRAAPAPEEGSGEHVTPDDAVGMVMSELSQLDSVLAELSDESPGDDDPNSSVE